MGRQEPGAIRTRLTRGNKRKGGDGRGGPIQRETGKSRDLFVGRVERIHRQCQSDKDVDHEEDLLAALHFSRGPVVRSRRRVEA